MSNKLMTEEVYNGVKTSPNAKKFLREVLVVDIQKRLGWKDVLDHEIFKMNPSNLPNTFQRNV